ncbi:MAG: succinylglutamate desuccinylase/aspartoacylase family protein [Candidatus Nanohaloarchaea archaeon]
MRIEKLGDGTAEYAVVANLHGDEPCGREAVEKFLSEEWEIQKPVKLIVANEKAVERDARYIDDDLNRSFPGDPGSDSHEERLAAELMEEVEDTKVIDFHSTRSQDEPFATVSSIDDETLELVRATGVHDVAYFPSESGTLNEQELPAVTIEAGRQGTRQAAKQAHDILVNFLAAEGVIDADHELSEPEIYRYYETVEGGDLEFVAENFSLVEEGEVFAYQGDHKVEAGEDFYPILMSTDGYEDILGYKAQKVEHR